MYKYFALNLGAFEKRKLFRNKNIFFRQKKIHDFIKSEIFLSFL